MTDEELDEIERRTAAATPGPWYSHRTDDADFMCALFIGTRTGPLSACGRYVEDEGRGMARGVQEQVPPESVVAITFLQAPGIAMTHQHDENTAFIAHARMDVQTLIAEVRRLRAALGEFPPL